MDNVLQARDDANSTIYIEMTAPRRFMLHKDDAGCDYFISDAAERVRLNGQPNPGKVTLIHSPIDTQALRRTREQ